MYVDFICKCACLHMPGCVWTTCTFLSLMSRLFIGWRAQNLTNEEQVVVIHARTVLTLAEKVWSICLLQNYFISCEFLACCFTDHFMNASVCLLTSLLCPVVRANRSHQISVTAENVGHWKWKGKCIQIHYKLLISISYSYFTPK